MCLEHSSLSPASSSVVNGGRKRHSMRLLALSAHGAALTVHNAALTTHGAALISRLIRTTALSVEW